jgi:hypothetical protein
MAEPYDPLPDLAAVIAGLMVPRSIQGGSVLGAALGPYDRLRRGLGLFGWDASDIEPALRAVLQLRPAAPQEPGDQCPACHGQRVDGTIVHVSLECPEMWQAGGPSEQ